MIIILSFGDLVFQHSHRLFQYKRKVNYISAVQNSVLSVCLANENENDMAAVVHSLKQQTVIFFLK